MKNKFNTTKGYGIEIEFIRPNELEKSTIVNKINSNLTDEGFTGCQLESYNHITRPTWKLVGDSSVHGQYNYRGGNELVSPILRGLNGKRQLEIVLKVLNDLGCKVNRSCGLHVHHDVTDTMVKGKKEATVFLNNLIKFTCKFEHFIYRLISPSRLTGSWCQPARRYFTNMRNSNTANLSQISKNIFKNVKEQCDDKYNRYGRGQTNSYTPSTLQRGRYCGLNLKNIWTRGSVEFRYHQGTLSFNKIWSWVVLTQAIINVTEVAKSVSFKNIPYSKDGFFYFRKALGFIGSKERCSEVKFANKTTSKRFKEMTTTEHEATRTRSSFYNLINSSN